jgi:tRNA(Ile)-lysidine synthase TilS/MesJ
MSLLKQVTTYSKTHNLITPGDKIIIGVSGGADSLCLLALLKGWPCLWV